MSTLYLIRHAQASFFADDYDQLSELGHEQARELGVYLADRRIEFDAVITGPAKRHIETAAGVATAYEVAGLPWPEPEVIDELDEHAADVFLRHSLDEVLAAHPHLDELADDYRRAEGRIEIQKAFQRLFEAVTQLWLEGRIAAAGVEPYAEFHARVCRGLKKILDANQGGRRVLAFSSVGPITAILQHSLRLDPDAALHLGWRLRNCTLNRFLFSGDRLTLDSFNSVAHLRDEMVTYR